MMRTSEDGRGLTDDQICDHMIEFFVGGLDTTAAVLTWSLYLLSLNPEVYRRLQAEVDTVLGGRTAIVEDLPKLELTQRVIMEALRLHPPAWVTSRMANGDTELGGHRLPAGANVVVSPYLVHRRADVFPEPDRFAPDRWLSHADRARAGYLPFGGGPRKCIGEGFTMTEGTLALASIVAGWELAPIASRPARFRVRLIHFPRSVPMRLTARHAVG